MGNLALLPSYLGREQRLLKEDAAAGGVHEGDTDGERTVRLQAMNAGHSSTVGDKHLSQSAAQLADHSGWLCWPTRWRDIAGTNKEHTVSAAFVSDSGHVVWGADTGGELRALSARRCRSQWETDPAVGALFAVPFLLDVVPHGIGLLLGVVSGALGIFAGMTLDSVPVDHELWTERTTSDPSLQ